MHVLLVEDDPGDEKLIRRMLPSETMVHCVEKLADAIKATRNQQFNLVLLDLGLPDSSGLETFTQLRAACPLVPIVVLTGIDDDALAMLAIREGAQDFLVKGYLDSRALRSLGFAVERDALAKQLYEEQCRRTELEKSMREQEQQLLHFDRVSLIGEVVSDISHEVSQPLQTVATLAGVLQSRDLDEAEKDVIERINECLDMAQKILRRTRNYAKPETSARAPVDINVLVKETVRFIEYEIGILEATLELDLHSDPLMVTAQGIQIQQVLVNLLRNAIDALKDQELQSRKIRIRTLEDGENVGVEVFDSGGGLGIETTKVFEPFVTTKPNGLGMGLAICSRIVEQHSGEISVETSQLGTIFRFSLPRNSKDETLDLCH